MKKTLKNYLIIFLSLLCILTCITYSPQALSDVHLVEDSDSKTIPKNFRKTTDLNNINKIGYLNLKGLDKLNISGSEQFTGFNLPLIQKEVPNNFSIIDIDLREESHGFINDIAVSFEAEKNNANEGLNLDEVIVQENKDLASIKLNEPLTFYNSKKVVTPNKVENELTLTKSNNISYLLIPVTDGGLPKDDMVDYFVDFVKNQPKDTWLHFHCKAGIGRTTTFMIMYDIMKNCNEVSLNDIIARQVLLSTISEKDSIDFFVGRRYTFLNDFYNRCKNNNFTSSSELINGASFLASTIIHFPNNFPFL